MSYSACDFVQDCENIAEAYSVPGLTGEQSDALGIDTSEEGPSEDEQQRILAERIAQALAAWQEFRAGLVRIRETTTDKATRDLAHALLEGR